MSPDIGGEENGLSLVALLQSVDSGISKLRDVPGFDARAHRQSVLDLRRRVESALKETPLYDETDDINKLANDAFDVVAHPKANKPRTRVEFSTDVREQFAKGKVCKIIYQTSHAPDYVMQLENGYFIRMLAPVEASVEDTRPRAVPEEKLKEKFESEHHDIVWLDKDQTPFSAKTK
jgi:hypothetical protein